MADTFNVLTVEPERSDEGGGLRLQIRQGDSPGIDAVLIGGPSSMKIALFTRRVWS